MLETSNFVHGLAMWSLILVMSECSLSERGQGHVSNFYIVDLENFATACRRYTCDIHNSVHNQFVYDTYKTMEATQSRHGWVHMFITHQPTLTLQLPNFDLFRTCRTSSFCTVAWQLARFQLTRCIARSLGDGWASCLCSEWEFPLLLFCWLLCYYYYYYYYILPLLLHAFKSLFSRTSWVSQYQKGKTSLDLNKIRDDAVLGSTGISWTMCKQSAPHSRQPDWHFITQFLQAGWSSWHPANSVKALKACYVNYC